MSNVNARFVWMVVAAVLPHVGCGGGSAGTAATCSSASDCEGGEVCLEGACSRLCYSAETCPLGLGCHEGRCAACAADAECAGEYACNATTGSCATACGSDLDCKARAYCSSAGACVAREALQSSCDRDRRCESGNCLDAVCCPEGCDTGCEQGFCLLHDGVACNGDGECASDLCVDRVCCATTCEGPCETCDGLIPGVCEPVEKGTDAECETTCDAGFCLYPDGTRTTDSALCASGWVVGGLCCDRECDEDCHSCTLPGSEGTCSPVRGQQLGDCRLTPGSALTCDANAVCRAPWRLADINGGDAPAYFVELASGEILFFAATDAGTGLWKADPVTQTTSLLQALPSSFGAGKAIAGPDGRTAYFFVAPQSGTGKAQIWRLDSVVAKRLGELSGFSDLVVAGDWVYFTVDPSAGGTELRRDRPGVPTQSLPNTQTGTALKYPGGVVAAGSDAYFTAETTAEGRELYRVRNAPDAKPELVYSRSGTTGSSPAHATAVGTVLYFAATSDAQPNAGQVLLSYDPARPTPVALLGTVCPAASPTSCAGTVSGVHAVAAAGLVYFFSDGASTHVWVTDGSNTHEVGGFPDASSWVYLLAHDAERMYVSCGDKIYAISLQINATATALPGTFSSSTAAATASRLYFVFWSSALGPILCRTNGTSAEPTCMNTWPVRVDSGPALIGSAGSSFYFVTDDPDHGRELWRCVDATADLRADCGPIDLIPGAESSYPTRFNPLVTAEGVVFAALAEPHGPFWLWRTDGASATRIALAAHGAASSLRDDGTPIWPGRTPDEVFVAADDGISGEEPWRVEAGVASRIGDLNAGPGGMIPYAILTVGRRIYVAGLLDGDRVWAVEGEPLVATRIDMELKYPNGDNAYPIAALGDKLYAAMRTSASAPYKLWALTGSAAAVVEVPELASPSPSDLMVAGDRLYFTTSGGLLWVLHGDGPPSQITAAPGDATKLTAVGGRLYFVGRDAQYGTELWETNCSDGAACPLLTDCTALESGGSVGLCRVTDLAAGSGSSNPVPFGVFSSRLAFAARDDSAAASAKLWLTPGTRAAADEISVACAVPAQCASDPKRLVQAGSRGFFIARYGVDAYGLWATDGAEAWPVMEEVREVVAFQDWAFFVYDGRLWATDGAPESTLDLGIEAHDLLSHGHRLYFKSGGELHVFP